jgi:hypothetical protein
MLRKKNKIRVNLISNRKLTVASRRRTAPHRVGMLLREDGAPPRLCGKTGASLSPRDLHVVQHLGNNADVTIRIVNLWWVHLSEWKHEIAGPTWKPFWKHQSIGVAVKLQCRIRNKSGQISAYLCYSAHFRDFPRLLHANAAPFSHSYVLYSLFMITISPSPSYDAP